MKTRFSTAALADIAADVVVCFTPAITKITNSELKKIDDALDGAVTKAVNAEVFTGKIGEVYPIVSPPDCKAANLLLVGLGDKKRLTADSYRKAAGILSRYKGLYRYDNAAFYFGGVKAAEYCQAAIEGYLLGSFKILTHKTGDNAVSPYELASIECVTDDKKFVKKLEKAVTEGVVYGEGQNLVRTLGMTPGNYLTPSILADKAKELARKHKLKCRVLDEKQIEKEKMGALLGVSKGSDEPPRFIILEYNGGPANRAPIVLVGKGVTFDSGGISLKPSLNMHEMKGDMCGSAVVLSTIVAAARLGIKQNIVTLIPTVENMPSGKATKPGDIHVSRKGLTIENINTDAEGRLILADALDYANKFKPQAVIDVATLTGATLFILGYAGAPIMGNNQKLLGQIEDASAATDEKVWPLPIWDEHRDQLKSPVADVCNSGGRPAGTITAAAFLENFIGDYPWAHIDIAYVDIEPAGKAYLPKGVTGIGMRLLTNVLQNWKKV